MIMGFSGWDGPKEHKLRKNKKAFRALKHYNKYRKIKKGNKRLNRLKGELHQVKDKETRGDILLRRILIILSIVTIVVLYPSIKKSFHYMSTDFIEQNEREKDQKKKVVERNYNQIIKEGDELLKKKEYARAIKRYEQVYDIKENNTLLDYKLTLVNYEMCLEEGKQCNVALDCINQIRKWTIGKNEWDNKRREVLLKIKKSKAMGKKEWRKWEMSIPPDINLSQK